MSLFPPRVSVCTAPLRFLTRLSGIDAPDLPAKFPGCHRLYPLKLAVEIRQVGEAAGEGDVRDR
jgi:hypothetical protein